MKTFNFFMIIVVAFFSLSLISCNSKSSIKKERKVATEQQAQDNARELRKLENQKNDEEILSDMDLLFNKTSEQIRVFVSKYGNLNDDYFWSSIKKTDRYYPNMRLCGLKKLKNCLLFTKESKNQKNEIYYSVRKEKRDSKSFFILQKGFWRNGIEEENRKEIFVLSTKQELEAALEPILKRLNEAKQSVKGNIRHIKRIAENV